MTAEKRAEKMFITDLDGTLFRSNHTFAQKDIQTLEDLKGMNIVRVIATGRSIYSLQRSINIKLPVDYLIFSTGAGIAEYPDPFDNILTKNSLSAAETQEAAFCLEDLGLDYMIQNLIPDNHKFSYRYKSKNNDDFITRLEFYKKHCSPVKGAISLIGESSQLLAIVPENKGDDMLGIIRERLHQFNVIKATSPFDGKTIWIEIFPKDTSKSSACSWLAGHLGISRANTIAIGNDYNDEDLLSWAGNAFVVDNAPETMKNCFHTVASNNDCGVTEAAKTGLDLLKPVTNKSVEY